MSYNPAPTWTDDIKLPTADDLRCPTCDVVAFNADEALEDIQIHSYHNPRHIPLYLQATCGNPKCADCDGDFRVYLRCEVTVVNAINKQPTSGMKAGYTYPIETCAYCGKQVAGNKMVQHLNEKHPLDGVGD